MQKGTRILWVLLILLIWRPGAPERFVSPALAAEDGAFTGTWVANGSKETLALGNEREASVFKLSGDVNLTNKVGKESNYWSECIGLADSESGSEIRCVWLSLHGDEIYLVMKGTRLEKGSSITGTFVGGSGAAKGISGTIRFTWSMMSFEQLNNETGKIGINGFSKDVSGTYKLP